MLLGFDIASKSGWAFCRLINTKIRYFIDKKHDKKQVLGYFVIFVP